MKELQIPAMSNHLPKAESMRSPSQVKHRAPALHGLILVAISFMPFSLNVKAETAIERILCRYDGSYVVFAQRPLTRLPFIPQPRPSDSFSDRNNVQLAHEHIFFCNNGRIERNVGFGPDGRFSEETISEKYRLVNDRRYNPAIINSILGPDACYISDVGTYGLRSNNCQDFAARVRTEYNRRESALTKKSNLAKPSCQQSVNSVINKIRSRGAKFTQYRLSKQTANIVRSGNPTSRNDEVTIVLRDRLSPGFMPIAQNLMLSKEMQTWATEVANNCGNTAVVAFGVYGTDFYREYLVHGDGSIKLSRCIEPTRGGNSKDRWGDQVCL
jgi:hypothetical protein